MRDLRPYLPGIGKRTGPDERGAGLAGSQGKANEMKDSKRETERYHPTYDELDAAIARARVMRARAMRDGVVKLGAKLRQFMAPRPTGLRIVKRAAAQV